MKRNGAGKFEIAFGNPGVGFGHQWEMEPSDASLWARSRAGDADAFGLLFERHAKVIYNYCFRRVGNWTAAEDALSAVFLEAWRRREKELAPDKVLPWLYGIATNVIRNRRRSERRFAAAIRRLPEEVPEPAFSDTADERLDDERRMQEALALLGHLPRHEQDVFALCVWSEVSYEEAAVALGVPIGTVRSRLARARQHLRELDVICGHEEGRNTNVQEALEP
jgi:RNA polymerase sigma-70 factor (ECF subfamily)